jgi:hypothetical protein
MNRLLLFLLVLPWFACQSNASEADSEAEAREARQAVFSSFAAEFEGMSLDSLAAFSLAQLAQDDSAETYPVSDSLLKSAISKPLLEQAGFIREGQFDGNSMYYAHGHFPFADGLEAYLIESYQSDNMRSTHMFLYDQQIKDFTYTHPLNFTMAGGVSSWERQAWLYDSNQDMMRDVVYLLEVKAQNEMGEEEYIISDSLRVESWTGKGFAVAENVDAYLIRSELGIGGGEETESSDGAFDFF